MFKPANVALLLALAGSSAAIQLKTCYYSDAACSVAATSGPIAGVCEQAAAAVPGISCVDGCVVQDLPIAGTPCPESACADLMGLGSVEATCLGGSPSDASSSSDTDSSSRADSPTSPSTRADSPTSHSASPDSSADADSSTDAATETCPAAAEITAAATGPNVQITRMASAICKAKNSPKPACESFLSMAALSEGFYGTISMDLFTESCGCSASVTDPFWQAVQLSDLGVEVNDLTPYCKVKTGCSKLWDAKQTLLGALGESEALRVLDDYCSCPEAHELQVMLTSQIFGTPTTSQMSKICVARKSPSCAGYFRLLSSGSDEFKEGMDRVCPDGLDKGQSICSQSAAKKCGERCTPCLKCADVPDSECASITDAEGNSCESCSECALFAECFSPGFYDKERKEEKAVRLEQARQQVQRSEQELAEKRAALEKLEKELDGLSGDAKSAKEQEIQSKEREVEQGKAQVQAATKTADDVSGSSSGATTALPGMLLALLATAIAVLV